MGQMANQWAYLSRVAANITCWAWHMHTPGLVGAGGRGCMATVVALALGCGGGEKDNHHTDKAHPKGPHLEYTSEPKLAPTNSKFGFHE